MFADNINYPYENIGLTHFSLITWDNFTNGNLAFNIVCVAYFIYGYKVSCLLSKIITLMSLIKSVYVSEHRHVKEQNMIDDSYGCIE